MKQMDKVRCKGCKFFVLVEEVCTEPTRPTGTDGKLHLVNWGKLNECHKYIPLKS